MEPCPTPDALAVKIDGAEGASGTDHALDWIPCETTCTLAVPLLPAS